jgi:hypothetical protein
MPTTKHSRNKIAKFSSQRLHDDVYLDESLPSYPSTINAQKGCELGHSALSPMVLFVLY